MENVVAQVSRYLDRIGAPLSSRKHGLVILAFSRALRRCAARLSRLELVGDSQGLSRVSSNDRWIALSDARLDLEKMTHRLSDRNAEVLMLRAAGYEWKEIATLLGSTVSHLRNSFWREIDQIRWCRNVCIEDSVRFTSTRLQ
jgi:DNA-directed RNA polymerase specialized sigma24 family protein